MVWPFSKKPAQTSPHHNLIFKSGAAFVENQCKYGQIEIKPISPEEIRCSPDRISEHCISALVLDTVNVNADGSQGAMANGGIEGWRLPSVCSNREL